MLWAPCQAGGTLGSERGDTGREEPRVVSTAPNEVSPWAEGAASRGEHSKTKADGQAEVGDREGRNSSGDLDGVILLPKAPAEFLHSPPNLPTSGSPGTPELLNQWL